MNKKESESGVGGWTDGELPQTGGVPFSLYLLILGISLLGIGLVVLGTGQRRSIN